jgi:hypothetical protein
MEITGRGASMSIFASAERDLQFLLLPFYF